MTQSGVKLTGLRAASLLPALLWIPAPGLSQGVSFGVSAGVPLLPLAKAYEGRTSTTSPYTFGPALRISLPRGFGIDVELLYKRLKFGSGPDQPGAAVHRLELPLMFRYSFSKLPCEPWLHAGMSFNRIIAVSGASVCGQGAFGEQIYCIGGEAVAELRHKHTHGPVLGAGVEFGRGRLRMAPEIRVTRWVDRNFGTRDSAVRSNLTQLDLLVRFNW